MRHAISNQGVVIKLIIYFIVSLGKTLDSVTVPLSTPYLYKWVAANCWVQPGKNILWICMVDYNSIPSRESCCYMYIVHVYDAETQELSVAVWGTLLASMQDSVRAHSQFIIIIAPRASRRVRPQHSASMPPCLWLLFSQCSNPSILPAVSLLPLSSSRSFQVFHLAFGLRALLGPQLAPPCSIITLIDTLIKLFLSFYMYTRKSKRFLFLLVFLLLFLKLILINC